MKFAILKAAFLFAFVVGAHGAAFADSPLFMPRDDVAPQTVSASEAEEMKKEADALKRKADLLKAAAQKKYTAAEELRRKAGGYRSESSQKGEALRSKAEQDAAVSGFIGEMFGMLSGMGGGNFSSNTALASAVTGKLLQGQQSMDSQALMDAHGKAGQMSAEADKKAGPLEMRADELENEGNRLMEAHNRLLGIANAKNLLLAAGELLRKIDDDSRRLERIREETSGFVTAAAGK